MTDEQLRAIAALCDAATPGSWKSGWSWQDAINGGKSAWSEGPVHVGDTLSQVAPQAIADAAFIAAARQDVPALLAEIADLRRQLHARIVAADRAVADARRERDDLRRQLTEAQAEIAAVRRLESELYGMRAQLGDSRDLRAQLESDNIELRRQLAEMQEEIEKFEVLGIAAGADNPTSPESILTAILHMTTAEDAADLRLSLAASEQARIKAEEMANVLRIRLSLDKPPPPPTCGHRGMAGSVGCILPAGHAGEHEYRTFADDHAEQLRRLSRIER